MKIYKNSQYFLSYTFEGTDFLNINTKQNDRFYFLWHKCLTLFYNTADIKYLFFADSMELVIT